MKKKRTRATTTERKGEKMMTLQETFGSVQPIQRPEDFKQLRDIAIEEHVRKFAEKMKE